MTTVRNGAPRFPFPRLAGATAVFVEGVVLLGWAFDNTAPKSVLPHWVAVKPNTGSAGGDLATSKVEPNLLATTILPYKACTHKCGHDPGPSKPSQNG